MAHFTLIGMILIEIAAFLHMVALVSPYWTIDWTREPYRPERKYIVSGLWSSCRVYEESTACESGDIGDATEGWVFTVRTFCILAMIALLGALFVTMLNFFDFQGKKIWAILAMKGCFLTAISLFLAVVVVGANSRIRYFHFAFAFEILTLMISIVAGIIHALDMRSVPETVKQETSGVKYSVNNEQVPENEEVKFVQSESNVVQSD